MKQKIYNLISLIFAVFSVLCGLAGHEDTPDSR